MTTDLHVKAHGRGIPMPAAATYIGTMRRSLASRVAALAIAILTGFSVPTLALAHGYAHHEAGEHAEQDHGDSRAPGAVATDELHHELPTSIQVAYEAKDHGHPQLAHAFPARMNSSVFVLSAIPVDVPARLVFVSTASLLLTAAPVRAGPADAPPRQPRAPPLG